MAMCSGTTFYTYNPTFWSALPIALAISVIVSFIFNFKGQKTFIAAGLVSVSMFLLYYSTFVSGSLTPYFLAVTLIFLGVFVNGSFMYFYRKFVSANLFAGE